MILHLKFETKSLIFQLNQKISGETCCSKYRLISFFLKHHVLKIIANGKKLNRETRFFFIHNTRCKHRRRECRIGCEFIFIVSKMRQSASDCCLISPPVCLLSPRLHIQILGRECLLLPLLPPPAQPRPGGVLPEGSEVILNQEDRL